MFEIFIQGLPIGLENKLEIENFENAAIGSIKTLIGTVRFGMNFENATIGSIKTLIIKTHGLFSIDPQLIRLQYHDKNLEDSQMLKEFDINNGDSIRYR